MSELKSLAHPDWPYAGTAHEWRGFVKDKRIPIPVAVKADDTSAATRVVDIYAEPIYQKQNFGPDLD